jgi:tetratricopeptide (TPR) repeat protein
MIVEAGLAFLFLQAPVTYADASQAGRAAAHHRLALAHARRGNKPEALLEFQRAVALAPGHAVIAYNLGVLHYNSGDYPQALDSLSRAHRARPARFDFHYTFAAALEAAGKLNEADGAYRRLTANHPREARGFARAAATAIRLNQTARARLLVKQALDLDPNAAEPHYIAGKIAETDGERERAYRAYAEAVRLEAGHLNAHYRLSVLCRRLEREEEAATHAKVFEELKRKVDAANLVLHGTQALMAGNAGFAIEHFERATAKDPASAQAWYYAGVAHVRQRQFARAAECLVRSLELDPSSVAAHAWLGFALAAGKDTRAADHLEAAAVKAAGDFDAQLTVSRGFLLLERWDRAEGCLLRSLEIFDGHPATLAELFQLYVVTDRLHEARRYAALAADANPGDAAIQYKVALFWAGDGQRDKALESAGAAARLAPQNEQIRRLLAELRRRGWATH